MKTATNFFLAILLSFSTFQMLRCARSNPFDPEGSGFNPGSAPWIAFTRDEVFSYSQGPTKFFFTWADTGVGGTKGEISAIQFDIDRDSVFEEADDDLSGFDTLRALVSFDSTLKSVIYARAVDKDGNTGNVDSISLSIYSGRPYILSFSGEVASFPYDSVMIWCEASDPNDKIERYEWALDGSFFTYSTSDSTLVLPPFGATGDHVVRVRAVDGYGAYSDTAGIAITVTDDPNSIDVDGPNIEFIGLADGDTVNSSVLAVELRVEDEKSAVKLVSVNDIDAVLTGRFEPIYQCTVSLNLGTNFLTAEAVDANFKKTIEKIRIVYDKEAVDQQPPEIQLMWPKEEQPLGVDSVTLSLQVTDPSGVSEVTGNGNALSHRSDNIWESGLRLVEGDNQVEVIAVDRKGNIDTVSFSFEYDPNLYDQVPPNLVVSQPSDGMHVTKKEITVSGSANDQSGINSLKVNGKSITIDGDYWETRVELSHGEDTITVIAVDGSSSKNKTQKRIVVVRNKPPKFLTKREDLDRNIILETNYVPAFAFQDPDGDEVTLRFSEESNWHSKNTPVLSVNTDSATVENYLASKVGVDTFVVIAEDKWGDTAVLQWTVVVSEPGNTSPSFTTDPDNFPDTLMVDSTYEFVVSAQDPDDKTLNYILKKPPTPAAAEIVPKKGEITWKPSRSDTGLAEFKVWVTDGADKDTLTWSMFVKMYNRKPDLKNPGNKTVDEAEHLIFTLAATDADGDALEYDFVQAPSWVKLSGNQCSVRPSYADSGPHTVVIEASEKNRTPSLSDRETITITVRNVNRAPQITDPGPSQVAEGVTMSIDLSAEDPDGDGVDFFAEGAPEGASIDGSVFTWMVPYDASESVEVTFIAQDQGNPPLRDSVGVTISVNNENRPPELVPVSDTAVSEDEELRITLKGMDPDGGAVTFFMDSTIQGADLTDSIFTWTPGFDQAGSHLVTFYVKDNATPPLFDSIQVEITVLDVNRKPEFAAIPDQSVYETHELEIVLHAQDPDGDQVSYSMETGVPGASFTAGVFTWTPSFDQVGNYAVTFKAHDDATPSLSDSIQVNITVLNLNRVPEITTDPEMMVSFVRVGGTVLDTVHAVDPDNDVIRFDIVSGPSGMTIGESNGILNWTAVLGVGIEKDTLPVTVRVRDAFDAEDQISWDLVVQAKWPRRFGDKFDDVARDAKAVSAGGYVVCGSLGTGADRADGFLLRLDVNGDTMWTTTVENASADDHARAVAEHPDGGFIVVGSSDMNGSKDLVVAKVSSGGVLEWIKSFGSSDSAEVGYDVVITSEEIIVCGIASKLKTFEPALGPELNGHRMSSTDRVLFLRMKLSDHQGKLMKLGKEGTGAFALCRTPDGGFALAGFGMNGLSSNARALLMKVSKTGLEEWSKYYGTTATNVAYGIDSFQGGFILAGESRTKNIQEGEWLIIGTNTEGDTNWTRSFAPSGVGAGYDVTIGNSIYVCGSVRGSAAPNSSVLVAALTSSGRTVWKKAYGNATDDQFGYAVDAGSDEFPIVAGKSIIGEDAEAYMLRLNSEGIVAQ